YNEHVCEAGKAIFAISANGDVFPCNQLPLPVGNIFLKKKIREIVHGESMLNLGSLKWKDIPAKKVFNFCPGINYTNAGNILTQPEHMLNAINVAFTKKKGGKK
ncbi:MAG: SPASM domain-containing protein, partial [Patescibacteria group bacterium]